MTKQVLTLSSMTKFGYPGLSTLSREPNKLAGSNREATKFISLNREATKYNVITNNVKPIVNNNNNRRGDRTDRSEKRWPLRGWEVENSTDDGIVAWVKRQSQDGRKGGKRKTPTIDAEYVIPISNRCTFLDDLDKFVKGSLHSQFLPKEQVSANKTKPVKDTRQYIKPENANNNKESTEKSTSGVGVVTPVGYTERLIGSDENIDRATVEIKNYKEAKAKRTEDAIVRERRSRSVPETHRKNDRDKTDQRSTAYHKIKRFLKLSKYDDRRLSNRVEEDEDEGYASKTSSMEVKDGDGMNSDSEVPELKRMFSSMIDLSELPSNMKEKENGLKSNDDVVNKVKFSYTHQPNILQIPGLETKLQLEKDRPERIDANVTYQRLKREKELRRCASTLCEPQQTVETSTMYNIDTTKPVTLVLRKISIQDSEERITAIISPEEKWSNQSIQPNLTIAQSILNSRANSRAGSVASRPGSVMSRPGSVVSKSGEDRTPRYPSRPGSRLSMRGGVNKENISTFNATTTKEPTWCPKHSHVSLFDKQATTYCISDLLPAMDKNIYNKQMVKTNGKTSDSFIKKPEGKTTDQYGYYEHGQKPSQDDGYMLLQKGLDILTGTTEKPTLGPPAFRPNQTRHPLIRNVTVVLEQNHDQFSPVHVGGRAKAPSPQTRVSSDKGPRPSAGLYEDRETQKKLKEAFARFYQNRPKDIGKEFRRMQTMWKA